MVYCSISRYNVPIYNAGPEVITFENAVTKATRLCKEHPNEILHYSIRNAALYSDHPSSFLFQEALVKILNSMYC